MTREFTLVVSIGTALLAMLVSMVFWDLWVVLPLNLVMIHIVPEHLHPPLVLISPVRILEFAGSYALAVGSATVCVGLAALMRRGFDPDHDYRRDYLRAWAVAFFLIPVVMTVWILCLVGYFHSPVAVQLEPLEALGGLGFKGAIYMIGYLLLLGGLLGRGMDRLRSIELDPGAVGDLHVAADRV